MKLRLRRGLTRSTIVGHIERIAASGVFVDVSSLVPSDERLAMITGAFEENGTAFIAPVKDQLGEDFDYVELRLARLYLIQQKGLSNT